MDGEEETVTVNIDDAFILKSDIDELCRLCANTDNQLIPIFKGEGLEHSIPSKIGKHLPIIKVTELDKLPLQICYQCASTLIAWHNLYEGCQVADKKLREIFSISSKLYQDDEGLTEYVEDYVNDFNDQSQDNYQKFPFSDSVNPSDIPTEEILISSPLENTTLDITPAFEETVEDTPNERCNDGEKEKKVVDADREKDVKFVTVDRGFDDTPQPGETTNTTTSIVPPLSVKPSAKCSICGNDGDVDSGQIMNDEFVCEICCRIKLEAEDTDWNYVNQYEDENEPTNEDTATETAIEYENNDCKSDIVSDATSKTVLDDTYQCAMCGKVYRNKKSMINHMKNHNEKVFPCKVCGKIYPSAIKLKAHKKHHIRKITNNTIIYCEVCKKYFKTKKGYAYHQQKICKQYKCYVCDETFLVESVLEDHMQKIHDVMKKSSNDAANSDGETVMSVCPVCKKVVTAAVLPRHMILHSDAKPFTCDLCGKQFKRKHSLQDHIMTEMGMKNYICDVCGMKFLKQGYLNKHMRYHKLSNGEYQGFRCELCDKRFPEKWRLGVHQRAVHKGGKFAGVKCDICGVTFAERWMVRQHKYVEHKGEEFKQYQCDVCGRKFNEKWMILSHQRSTHKSGVRKLYCDLCGRSDHLAKDCQHRHALQEVACLLCGDLFPSNYYLKEHVVSKHNFDREGADEDSLSALDSMKNEQTSVPKGSVLYMCDGCGKQFNSKQLLKAHETSANCRNDTKYECEDCGKVFHSKSSLSNHVMRHRKAIGTTNIYRCDLCGKEFVTEEALENHMSLDKICLLCGKVYPCNDQLKNHVYAEHSDNDSVSAKGASTSNMVFDDSMKDEMADVMDVDESQNSADDANKPFACRLCGKKFARKQAMKNHMFAEMNLRRYVCEFCDKSYNYYSHLKEHIVTNHGEKEFVCGYCGKDFPTKKRFRDHVTLHSEDKPFPCECGLSFKLSRYLSKHKKRCKVGVKKE